MSDPHPRLIVGLGNPGKDYEKTRHNLGFCVAKEFARRYKAAFEKSLRLKAMVASFKDGDDTVYVMLPLTFMNNSGAAVKAAIEKYNIALSDVLILSDDLNLEFGTLRLRSEGSDGGHNGLSSIIAHVQSKNFVRLRLGIGRPARKEDVVDFVLTPFNGVERKALEEFISRAADACEVWLKEGSHKAMDQFNKRTNNA